MPESRSSVPEASTLRVKAARTTSDQANRPRRRTHVRAPSQVPDQTRNGVAALHHVKDRQGHEGRPHDQMRPSLGDQRHGGQRSGEGRQQEQVDCESGSRPAALGHRGTRRRRRRRRRALVRQRNGVTAERHGRLLHRPGGDPDGSRPASTQPTRVATIGMAITMKKQVVPRDVIDDVRDATFQRVRAEPAEQPDIGGHGPEQRAQEGQAARGDRRQAPPGARAGAGRGQRAQLARRSRSG